jgi:hypothetical protein
LKVALHVVVTEAPAKSVRLRAYSAQRFKHFEQANIVAAFALHEREGIVCGNGVDGEMLFGSGAGEQESGDEDGKCG